ncbi:CidA/LrgA family protein [Planktomarina temperata]|nr:CidA/LrgA family protein [Planktomarina temperata]MDC1193052.1 CidA/LrgA family protein [Planktomarina temperata]MDC1233374.1 CidA/LrgA family protein [Planktomarina temperata]
MLRALGLLLGCQLAGEFITRGLGLPIPGPVLGLVILLAALALRPPLASALRPTTQVILAHLSLMFVPAGVGVIGNLDVLSSDWARLLVVLILSTILSMLVTVATFIAMKRLMYRVQK